MKKKFEYLIIEFSFGENMKDYFNNYGSSGWEFIQMIPLMYPVKTLIPGNQPQMELKFRVIFKRELANE